MPHDPASRNGGTVAFMPLLAVTAMVWSVALPSHSSRAPDRPAGTAAHAGVVHPERGQLAEVFGFSVGEERRWTVESDAFELRPGELLQWKMRLESVDVQTGELVAHFLLEHEGRLFSRRHNIFNPDELDTTSTTTELWANERGFPLRVMHRDHRSGTISRSGAVDVRWERGGLRVTNADAIGYREYALDLPGAGALDLERPEGVFLSPDVNPGLLALPFMLANTEWEAGTRIVTLDPSALVDPNWTRARPPDASVGPGGAAFGSRPPTPRQLSERSLRPSRLKIASPRRIQVAGATTAAHRVEVGGGNDAWIAPDGRVLYVDSTLRRTRARIRLLRPAEY